MNESKWREALKLSRFHQETQTVHAKVMPVLDYVARLAHYPSVQTRREESLILQDAELRRDQAGVSLSPSVLKGLSSFFVDSYFAVPKVLESEEGGDV